MDAGSWLPWYPVISCREVHEGGTYLDAIVAGGTQCEMTQCDHSVGYGGR